MTETELVKKHSDLIWTIANLLRGPYRPPQYRRVMIPLVVLRRLDSVLEATKADVLKAYNKLKADEKYDEETIEKMLFHRFDLKFFNTSSFTFAVREKGVFARLVALLKLVQEHCEEYLKREVLPYRPDARIDHDKIKVGYEIPFTRHFYTYEPPRPLNEIAEDIKGLESDIVRMLSEVTA